MRAVVLGGRGFLGRHVVVELESHGVQVTVAGLEEGLDLSWTPRAEVVAALRAWAPDVLVNATGRTIGDPAQLRRDNVVATDRLLRCCAIAVPGLRMVHLGSAAEYGPSRYGVPVGVGDDPCPGADYGRTKLEATRLVAEAGERGVVDPVVLRVFNPLGAGQPAGTMPGNVAAQLARSPDGIIRVGRLDAWRDFISAVDVARAVLAAALAPELPRRVLNVGSGQARSTRKVAQELIRLAGGAARLEESGAESQRSGQVSWQQADISATREVLDWEPRDELATALGAVLAAGTSTSAPA